MRRLGECDRRKAFLRVIQQSQVVFGRSGLGELYLPYLACSVDFNNERELHIVPQECDLFGGYVVCWTMRGVSRGERRVQVPKRRNVWNRWGLLRVRRRIAPGLRRTRDEDDGEAEELKTASHAYVAQRSELTGVDPHAEEYSSCNSRGAGPRPVERRVGRARGA